MIKHDGYLRTLEKFSNIHRVLLQCNTRFRLLYLLDTSIVNKKFVRFCFCVISGIIKVFVQLL